MKALILMSGLIFGVYMGLYPSLERPRPSWWKWILVVLMSATCVLGLIPRLGATFADAVIMSKASQNPIVPLKVKIQHETVEHNGNITTVKMTDFSTPAVTAVVMFDGDLSQELQTADVALIKVKRETDAAFHALSVIAVNPLLTLPFIPGLEERARNIFFHVPLSWVACLAYLAALIYSVNYLRKKDMMDDVKASSAAAVGTLFTILATITGSIWAKFNWGSFWNWDPRETSIFILLLIYGAYFALRMSLDNDRKRAQLSSVYAIFAFVTVPFLVFIMPRIMEGLHPGSSGDVNAGPVISPQPDALNILKQIELSLAFAAFTMLFFWLLSLTIRVKKQQLLIENKTQY